ncbi:V-type ATP synthase subunit I [Natrinema longum]|uniref:A-type ATP synthase subunit I n=1 Tax=Natrinema longum TaxID=370324 RepID=A0A8A2UJN4_9EURY|nr:V-type ATP synthase subunit I [Natrinema longum]MBZ6495583.1 V-type ATP synthase subunit I [Natrinema longum]QSW86958.1 V-type ATP synthase subunit I [Natrinema longum]
MPTVIEAVHELSLVHLSDYDGSWDGFDNGNPMTGADDASEKLVTVRALESTLELSADEADPGTLEEGWEDRLEEIRTRINDLDDRRVEINDELRQVDEKIDRVAPFAELGIDLDLLSGYETVDVLVGEGPLEEVEAAVDASDDVRAFETFTGGDVVAIVAAPAQGADEEPIDDALVGVEFTRYEVPDTEQSPEDYVADLESRKRDLESQLEEIDAELAEIKQEEAAFLLRVEEELTIEVQQAEAPLQFATTDHAFVAEGWLPTEEYDRLVATLNDAVGDSVEVEELVRADYNDEGYPTRTEDVDHGGSGGAEETTEAEEREAATQEAIADGGTTAASGDVVTMVDEPPVIQDNTGPAKPFEFLLRLIDRPKYSELDPTIVLLLTFPAFYGFMLGDLGYGMIYTAVGFLMYSRFDEDIIRSLGAIGMWAGGFTMLFGVLYGEFFGMHFLGEVVFGGSPPLHKGLQPVYANYGQTWLMVSVLIGLAHLTLGYAFGFFNDLDHGVTDAFLENGSWALLMVGVWVWIFSRHGEGVKPDFLYTSFGTGSEAAFELGFTGFATEVGLYAGLPIAAIGFVTMVYGEVKHYGVLGIIIGGLESFNVLGDVLSYLRIAAVILAKAGMAFVVNMLFFGVYVVETDHGAEWHFGTSHAPQYMLEQGTYHGHEVSEVMFGGLLHGGLVMAILGVVILVVGHIVVLLLGITSAGLQGIRLEYVEFFNRFYEGGGRTFEPFGGIRSDDD